METITLIAAIAIILLPAIIVLFGIIENRAYIANCRKAGKKLIKV